MDFYIDSGKWLIDKDRNINSDLEEINAFFEPIDRLFGDYEIRKKNKLEELLYRDGDKLSDIENKIQRFNNLKNRVNPIKDNAVKVANKFLKNLNIDPIILNVGLEKWKESIRNLNRGSSNRVQSHILKIKKSEIIENEKNLLYFVITKISSEYRVDYTWVRIKEDNKPLGHELTDGIHDVNRRINAIYDSHEICATYILDPVKLSQIIEYDDVRIESHKKVYFRNIFNDFDKNANKEIYFTFLDKIVEERKKNPNFDLNTIDVNISQPDKRKIIEAVNNKVIKLKNLAKFESVRVRLGMQASNRLVLFLHPYISESHQPGRIPSE